MLRSEKAEASNYFSATIILKPERADVYIFSVQSQLGMTVSLMQQHVDLQRGLWETVNA
ncbi:hypothetical protein [Vagococcus acidifermentans]|uniref:hypothetical protein n=1 Tax=Vagococcus acidifermentans TaxID=564710 RepID=UPI001B878DBB|nr:hypothetical protein [Vagococcus acidifermentans]